MSTIIIDGAKMASERDVHLFLREHLRFPDYYGMNVNALWDCLTCEAPRPLVLQWIRASESRRMMGRENFDAIASLMRAVEDFDARIPSIPTQIRFRFILEE